MLSAKQGQWKGDRGFFSYKRELRHRY